MRVVEVFVVLSLNYFKSQFKHLIPFHSRNVKPEQQPNTTAQINASIFC
jgi:hypothetical protein